MFLSAAALLCLVKVEQMEQWPPAPMTHTTVVLGSKPQYPTWTMTRMMMTMMKMTKMTNPVRPHFLQQLYSWGLLYTHKLPLPVCYWHTFNFPPLFLISWRALRSMGFKGVCWFHSVLSSVWLRLWNHSTVLLQVLIFCLDSSSFQQQQKKDLWDFEVAALCHPASAGISMTYKSTPLSTRHQPAVGECVVWPL